MKYRARVSFMRNDDGREGWSPGQGWRAAAGRGLGEVYGGPEPHRRDTLFRRLDLASAVEICCRILPVLLQKSATRRASAANDHPGKRLAFLNFRARSKLGHPGLKSAAEEIRCGQRCKVKRLS